VNIGTLGHVDHGKTSLIKALTGIWTDRHSEELKRGITIKLGYAETTFYRCPNKHYYCLADSCPVCKEKPEYSRRISFLDAPGHETLMTTAIAASSIVDGVVLVIAANEECPQPQTLEHVMVMSIMGIKNVVVVQNKIDLVSKEQALQNYNQIKKFLSSKGFEDVPIIPVSANFSVNLDGVIEALETRIPTKEHDTTSDPILYIARSFDINRPGTLIKGLKGGVIGGSVIKGTFHVGDEVEIRPGFEKEEKGRKVYEPIITGVSALHAGDESLQEAIPGGLVAIGTNLDPTFSKSDRLTGNIVGKPGKLPPILDDITIEFHLLERPDLKNPPLALNEAIVVCIGTKTSVGFVESSKHNKVHIKLKGALVGEKGQKVAVCRKIGQRWRLAGYGIML